MDFSEITRDNFNFEKLDNILTKDSPIYFQITIKKTWLAETRDLHRNGECQNLGAVRVSNKPPPISLVQLVCCCCNLVHGV